MDKRQKPLLSLARLLVAVLLCAAVVGSLLAVSLQALFKRDLYVTVAASDTVVSALHAEVLEQLESECLFYDLPYNTMKTALPENTVRTALAAYADDLYTALDSGALPSSVALDTAPFKAAIDLFFDTLPAEERPLDPDASQTIAQELSENISHVLSMGIGEKVLKTAHPLFARAHRLVDTGVWLLLTAVVLAAVSMIPTKSTLRERAYGTASSLFVGCAIVAAPTWLFVSLDFPAKLAIGDSALREYVNGVLYTALDRMTAITTTAFVISAVLLIASVVWNVKTKKEKTA